MEQVWTQEEQTVNVDERIMSFGLVDPDFDEIEGTPLLMILEDEIVEILS